MMEMRKNQKIIEHHRLFDVGPRSDSLAFASDKVKSDLLGLCQLFHDKIGQGQFLLVYPHRILQQGMWAVQLIGEQDKIYLLLSITGYFRVILPAQNEHWPVRWQIDVADHIDAYWFIKLLAQELGLQHTEIKLSTESVDNQGVNDNGTSKINT